MLKTLKYSSSEHNIFFTSDLHLGHKYAMYVCNRPFKEIEEMNEALINNWNSVVGKDDIIFNLGDFVFGTNAKWKEYIPKLNGHHHLIMGNHDVRNMPSTSVLNMFESVNQQLLISIDNRKVYLNHYPFLCYAGTYRGPEYATIQLFGHVHSRVNDTGLDAPRLVNLFPYQYDVGVDNNNYTPVSWQQILNIINKQTKDYETKRISGQ